MCWSMTQYMAEGPPPHPPPPTTTCFLCVCSLPLIVFPHCTMKTPGHTSHSAGSARRRFVSGKHSGQSAGQVTLERRRKKKRETKHHHHLSNRSINRVSNCLQCCRVFEPPSCSSLPVSPPASPTPHSAVPTINRPPIFDTKCLKRGYFVCLSVCLCARVRVCFGSRILEISSW